MVVIIVLAAFFALLLPWTLRARERSRREVCKRNLKQFSLAVNLYSNDWNDWYPTTGVGVPRGQERSLRCLSLLNCCYISASEVYVCPSTSDRPKRLVIRNHRVLTTHTPSSCSYAYDPQKPPGTNPGVAICADRPALTDPGSQNSTNHGNQGQNVLYFDGHVEWAAIVNVGLNGDNIFTGTWSGPGNTLPVSDTYCTQN